MSAAPPLATSSLQGSMKCLTGGADLSKVTHATAIEHGAAALKIEGLGAGVEATISSHVDPTSSNTAHQLPELGSLKHPRAS
jgi:hypothetical protein